MRTEHAPRSTIEQVCMEEIRTETQEKPVEENIGQETGMDTQISEASEPSDSQRKRTGEQVNGSRKKEKAHRTPMQTSLTTDNVELIATTVEYRLSKVWENVDKHRVSILEQVQDVKTTLENLRIKTEQQQKEKPT
jgi:hypothetical protein